MICFQTKQLTHFRIVTSISLCLVTMPNFPQDEVFTCKHIHPLSIVDPLCMVMYVGVLLENRRSIHPDLRNWKLNVCLCHANWKLLYQIIRNKFCRIFIFMHVQTHPSQLTWSTEVAPLWYQHVTNLSIELAFYLIIQKFSVTIHCILSGSCLPYIWLYPHICNHQEDIAIHFMNSPITTYTLPQYLKTKLISGRMN